MTQLPIKTASRFTEVSANITNKPDIEIKTLEFRTERNDQWHKKNRGKSGVANPEQQRSALCHHQLLLPISFAVDHQLVNTVGPTPSDRDAA